MKKISLALFAVIAMVSCNNQPDKNKFSVKGEIKNLPDQQVYLEQLFFSNRPPEVLDTGTISKGKFQVQSTATEEGLYRLRLEKSEANYIFINDAAAIDFTGDISNPSLAAQIFNTPANLALRRLVLYSDSMGKTMGTMMNRLKEAQVSGTDSLAKALEASIDLEREGITRYCFRYADTSKNPVLALFAATMAPVELPKLELPLKGLVKRFPGNAGIEEAVTFISQQAKGQQQPQNNGMSKAAPGTMAPEISMNDVDGKPFSLSQLRGKYVLVDFWASWCGPCRGENPNVVLAYNTFKDNNFTVLGVSLDEDKASWVKAIADDRLTWQHISDLKKWRSAAVELYGFDGIPFNVLVDPTGKIIANNLRGPELQDKLAALLK